MACVLGVDGNIYGSVGADGRLPVVNPVTKQIEIIQTSAISEVDMSWYGGVLAEDGNIYYPPFNHNRMLRFRPNDKIAELVGDTVPIALNLTVFAGAVLGTDGNIYCISHHSSVGHIHVFNPNTLTWTHISAPSSVAGKWNGGCLAPNGNIYLAPNGETQALMIDIALQTATRIGTNLGTGQAKWCDPCLAPNGMLYCAPLWDTHVLKIDPNTNTTQRVGGSLGTVGVAKWVSFTLANNGKLYALPVGLNVGILEFDPVSETSNIITLPPGFADYYFSKLASNGNIYSLRSASSNAAIEISFTGNNSPRFASTTLRSALVNN
jgi:streptogramin lyase